MDDYVLRIIAQESGFRALLLLTTQISSEACERHKTTAAATPVLADGMTAAAMLGSLLKMKQRIALRFEGDGPIGKMITESTSHGLVRGYIAHPEAEGDNPLGNQGTLRVVKDVGLKDLIQGVVERKGSIQADILHFLETSEQTQSIVSLATVQDEAGQVEISGGLLIQLLPGGDPAIIDKLADRLQEMPPLGDMLKAGAEDNPDVILETIADGLFEGTDSKTLEKRWLFFHCGCSRERSESALISLGVTELQQLIETHEDVTTDCQFCNEQYVFTREDISGLIDQIAAAG
ncbi:MAG: Hsp33 family molecular chaperone HslO [Chloroflexota bacterium]